MNQCTTGKVGTKYSLQERAKKRQKGSGVERGERKERTNERTL